MQNHGFHTSVAVEDCPSDSEFAALLDGTLEPARAEEVRRHVLDCDRCFEVYSDAHRFEAQNNVVPFQRKRGIFSRPPMRVAAGLVAAALSAFVAWPLLSPVRHKTFTPEDAARLSFSPVALQVLEEKGDLFRDDEGDSRETRQARLNIGARLVDLRVALAHGKRQAVDRCLTSLLQSAELLGTEAAGESTVSLGKLRKALEPLDQTGLQPDLAKSILDAAEALREKEPGHGRDYQDLGHWTEAGWLAAASQDGALFKVEKYREFLDWLQSKRGKGDLPIELSENGLAALDDVVRDWPGEGNPNPPYEKLTEAFKRIQQDAGSAAGSPTGS